MIRLVVKFDDATVKMRVRPDLTVGGLAFKLREFYHLKPAEAMFLFFSGRLYPGAQQLCIVRAQINHRDALETPLEVEVCRENAFGGWSKLFVKASVVRKKELFVARITWSWYGVSHYDQIEIFDTLNGANLWILKLRTDGHLVYDTGEEEKKDVDVDQA